MESNGYAAAVTVCFLVSIGLVLTLAWMLRSLKNELEETRKNFREVASHYDQCRERVRELEDRLKLSEEMFWKERQEKERLDGMVDKWIKANDGKCDRIKQLQSALKAISEMAEESSHL